MPPPDEVTEVVNGLTESADPRGRGPEEIQPVPAPETPVYGRSSSEQDSDEDGLDAGLSGASAADILWALEQAYQNQEQRIRSLEATLRDQSVRDQSLRDQMHDDVQSGGSEEDDLVPAVAEGNRLALGASDAWAAESGLVPKEAVALTHEPVARFVLNHEPVEVAAFEENQAASLTQQQVVIVNHYQPVFLNHPTPTGTSSQRPGLPRNSAMSVLEQRRSQIRQDLNQRSPTTGSWVASGFDVYSR